MPYSHPYKPNPGQTGGQSSPMPPMAGTPAPTTAALSSAPGTWAAAWTRRRLNLSRRPRTGAAALTAGRTTWTARWTILLDRVVDLGTNVGAGVLGAISDALASAGDAISGWAKPDKELTFAQWRARIDRRLKNSEQGGYLAMAITGAVFAASFGIAALVMFILSAVGPEALNLAYDNFVVFPS